MIRLDPANGMLVSSGRSSRLESEQTEQRPPDYEKDQHGFLTLERNDLKADRSC